MLLGSVIFSAGGRLGKYLLPLLGLSFSLQICGYVLSYGSVAAREYHVHGYHTMSVAGTIFLYLGVLAAGQAIFYFRKYKMELIGGFAGFLVAQYLFTFFHALSIHRATSYEKEKYGLIAGQILYQSPYWWVWVLDVLAVAMGTFAGITLLKRIYPKYYSFEIYTAFLGTSNLLAAATSKYGNKYLLQCDLIVPDINSWWQHCGYAWIDVLLFTAVGLLIQWGVNKCFPPGKKPSSQKSDDAEGEFSDEPAFPPYHD